MFARHPIRFRNREDAGRQLATKLKDRALTDPLVLGVPRGGIVVGAVLAREIKAELDVVLVRKLRAPGQPELAIGAVCEEGKVFLNPYARDYLQPSEPYLKEEIDHQLAEIQRRRRVIRTIRDRASIQGRSVIVTDDGIATGSTVIAALQIVRSQEPRELLVAAPVASPDRLAEVAHWCDEVVCLLTPSDFYAIGQFYDDFTQVEDEEAMRLLKETASSG